MQHTYYDAYRLAICQSLPVTVTSSLTVFHHTSLQPTLSPSSAVVLNHVSSHFLIPLSDSSLICTVPTQWVTHHFRNHNCFYIFVFNILIRKQVYLIMSSRLIQNVPSCWPSGLKRSRWTRVILCHRSDEFDQSPFHENRPHGLRNRNNLTHTDHLVLAYQSDLLNNTANLIISNTNWKVKGQRSHISTYREIRTAAMYNLKWRTDQHYQ